MNIWNKKCKVYCCKSNRVIGKKKKVVDKKYRNESNLKLFELKYMRERGMSGESKDTNEKRQVHI